MQKHLRTLSITLLLAAGCTQDNSLGGADQGSGGSPDLSSGSRDDQGSGNAVDGGGVDGGGVDGGVVDGGGVLQPGLNLLAGRMGGSGNADRVGTAARFEISCAAAADGIGNLYVADTRNHLLRKIVLATGAVTTVGRTVGESYGVAADGAGNVYYSDRGTYAIHKLVTAAGTVTTLAGGGFGSADGIGTAARFNAPAGLSWDGAGNLFVADASNHTIRQIVIATGAVTTLAGTAGMSGSADGTGGVARFNTPSSLAADKAGKLYIADTYNATVRQLVVSTGVVTTVAGMAGMTGGIDATGAAARFSFPAGVAVDAVGNLYIADANNAIIRKIVAATGVVTTLAGKRYEPGSSDGTGTAASFQGPYGIALDGTANLYITEAAFGGAVRKLDATTGAVTTFAGLPPAPGGTDGTAMAAQFREPRGLAADAQGHLFVADYGNSTVRQIAIATGAVTTLAGKAYNQGSDNGIGAAARFYAPTGLVEDGAGNLYVADSGNHTIRKIVTATGEVTTLAGAPNSSGSSDGPAGGARFYSPVDLALDQKGNLYVADLSNCTVRKLVLATGDVSTIAGTAGSCMDKDGTGAAARFTGTFGLTADGAGSLYVGDVCSVRKVDLATGTVTTIAGTAASCGAGDGIGAAARFNSLRKVLVDGTGSLLIVDLRNQTLRKLVLATGSVTTVLGTTGQQGVYLGALPGGLNFPFGIARLPNGGLAISSSGENAVLVAGSL